MISNEPSKNKKNGNDNQTKGKKRTIEIIKDYLNSQTEHLQKLKNDYKLINEVIKQFIDQTKNYCSHIELIAMKIIPNYSTEGQMVQAVQGVLLFFSDGLNNLIKELQKNNMKEEKKKDVMEEFNEYKKSYFLKLNNSLISFEDFQNEISLYQEYLVNKEYISHMKKGDLKNNDDAIIDANKIEINNNVDNKNIFDLAIKDEKNTLQDYDPFSSIDYLNDNDNHKELIEKNNLYLSNLKKSNEILEKIKEFLSKEKTNLRKNIFNISVHLIEGLINCVQNQKQSFDLQNEVIKSLTNNLKCEETDKNEMKPMNYKLKYLEIYENIINEKTSQTQENEIFSSNTSTNLNVRRKSIKSNKSGRSTISYNPKDIKLKLQKKEDQYKLMIKKLSRNEILNIFEKIKKTNIMISEHDLQIIEKETNYNKIKEILTMIFLNKEKYTENDKNIIISYFEKDKIYIVYFIKLLNDHRTKGDYIISEETLKYLGELFKFINNLILSKNDMELFKFILILSMTYFYKSKDEMKIYLFSYIKDHPDYQKEKFWDEYLQELIEHDLKGQHNQDIYNQEIENLNKAQKEKLNNLYFSNFLATVKAMADFEIDQKRVRNFVERNKSKYLISQEQIENICMVYDMTSNENKTKHNGVFLNNKNKVKNNIEDEDKEIKDDKEGKNIINE